VLWAAWAGHFLAALVRSQSLPGSDVGLQSITSGLILVGVAVLTAGVGALVRRR
jgi:hypothetical protein